MKNIAMKLATLGLLATVIAAPMTVNASGFDKQDHRQDYKQVNRDDRKDGDRGYQQLMNWKRDDRRDRDDHRVRDDHGRFDPRHCR